MDDINAKLASLTAEQSKVLAEQLNSAYTKRAADTEEDAKSKDTKDQSNE